MRGFSRALGGISLTVIALIMGLVFTAPKKASQPAKAETSQIQKQDYGKRSDTFSAEFTVSASADDDSIISSVKNLPENKEISHLIQNPLEPNDVLDEFAEKITKDEHTLDGKLRELHYFINKYAVSNYDELLPVEMVQYCTKKEKEKGRPELPLCCRTGANLFAALARTIAGVQEAVVSDALLDYDGTDIKIKFVNNPHGFRHVCVDLMFDNRRLKVDVIEQRGFGFPYQKTKKRNKNSDVARYSCGKASDLDYNLAMALLRAAVSIAPEDAYIHFELGNTCRDNREALKHMLRANRLEPGDFGYLRGLANAFCKMGKQNPAFYDNAFEAIRQCLEICPNYADGHRTYATIYEKTGNYEAAEKELEIAIRLKLDDWTIRHQLKLLSAKIDKN